MKTAVFIIAFVILDIVIIGCVFWALAMEWNAIAQTYPACEPKPGAIRRKFQSCSMGIFNLGWSTHIITDDEYLHIQPALFLRLSTNRSLSIPWDDVIPGKYQFFRRFRKFKIGRKNMVAPSWAVDLAEPNDD